MLGGLDLAASTWAEGDVDLVLPTDGPSVVIGRTFNHRQGSGSSITASDGPQGVNWFQSAMPEIVFSTGLSAPSDADDIVYVVLGAGKFLEYKRRSSGATVFVGVNGASGAIKYVAGSGGSTPYDTYELTDAAGTVWTFWGSSGSHTADWQFWKKTDAAGRSAYVGSKSSHTTAVAGYNTDGTIKKIYQELGTGADLRQYTFTYGVTIGSVNRLTQVDAEENGEPCGQVKYEYYTSRTPSVGTDLLGNAGDLMTVKVSLPLIDNNDERVKHYRYYDSYANSNGQRGHAHAIKLILGNEGARRYDWLDSTFDDDFESTGVATSTLKDYCDAYFEYESAGGTQRVTSAVFNGCGCGGSSGSGTYELAYEANPSYSNTSGYDTAWKTRAVIKQPDNAYLTRYFDEVGQPLSSVVSDGDPATGGKTYWVTGVVRNSSGQVTEVHSPANIDSSKSGLYTHNFSGNPDGSMTFDGKVGLITLYDRYQSGEPSYDSELDGMLSGVKFQEGTGGSVVYTSKNVLGKRGITVGAATVVRPLVSEARAYHTATSSYGTSNTYDPTVYTYDWWDTSTNTNQLYVTPKSVTTTLPAVKNSSPDQNGANVTHDVVSYLRKDGRPAITVAADGIYTAYKYNELGLPIRTVLDADPSVSGDFDTGYGPGNFGLSTSSNGGLTYATDKVYDIMGRPGLITERSGTAASREATYIYDRLADHRLATLMVPYFDYSFLFYFGPAQYTVTNQNGGVELTATVAQGGMTGLSLGWWDFIDDTVADPLDAVYAGLVNTDRSWVKNLVTTIYDTPGARAIEQRKYLVLAASGSWTGTAGTDYDVTTYGYDSMSRRVRVQDPTGTIDRVVYDAIGRQCATWTGTSDSNWTSSGNGSGDNMTQTSATAYDGATIGGTLTIGNGYVTKRAAYTQEDPGTANGTGDSATARTSTMFYDVRGNLVATHSPEKPHTVNAYDVRRRVIASAIYSDTAGVDETVNPLTDDTLSSGATIRLGASERFYDSRGSVYKTVTYKVDQTTGADTDSLESLTWYDSAGRAIKTGGTSLTKTFYDRLGRPINRFTLARCNDSSYSDVLNSVSGDIVLEENQTVYDDYLKTGQVLMTVNIIRNHDDTTTTTALDSNADGDRYKVTAANLAGRAQITAMWYDTYDRLTDTVVYGTNGGSDFNRSSLGVPNRGSGGLRTTNDYDAWGRVNYVEAPRIRTGPTGYRTGYVYDMASRKIAEIRNMTPSPSNLSTSTRDNDVYTRYVYTNGLMTRMWVDLDGDNTVDATDQVTDYTFAVVKTGSGVTPPPSKVASNRMLVQAAYPVQTSGQSTSDRSEYFAYNAAGEKITGRDQNGTVHDYTYDNAGKLLIDAATTCGTSIDLASSGSNIDTTVRRIQTVYDNRGLTSTVTQYDALSSGSVLDQVKYTYDEWGNLTNFQQDYNNAVGTATADDLGVLYTWSKVNDTSPAGGSNKRRSGLRITDVEYQRAGSSAEHYKYAYSSSSLYDDDIGRVTSITNSAGSTTFAEYRYGGVGMVVRTTLSQPGITDELTTTGTSGYNTYLDDFNRVIRNRWRNTTTGGVWYDAKPGYDANSNITSVENAWVTPWSALYTSDGLNRLTVDTIGTLASGAISNANTWRKETWLDASGNLKLSQTGNWGAYTSYFNDPSVSGNDEYSQTRVHSLRNEITSLTEAGSAVGGSYSFVPRYARNGSTTRDDTGASGHGFKYFYDAWNRVVKVQTVSSTTIAEYRYNGLGHRIGWKARFDTGQTYANNLWRYFQYNEKWQQVGMYQGTTASTGATGLYMMEAFLYHAAGLSGLGGSSYIDKTVFRDRDVNGFASSGSGDNVREERRYYLQNWRNDVVELVKSTGEIVERYRYDAYGRPSSFSPGDVAGLNGGPDGQLTSTDNSTYGTAYGGGTPTWQCDLGQSGTGAGIPDNVVDADDGVAFIAYYGAAYTGGFGLMSDAAVDNRKGFAGYEFDPILSGTPTGSASVRLPLYHVRYRVLNCYTGKWFQRDPLGYHDGMDLYEYCKSDPENSMDPLGLVTADWRCIQARPRKTMGPNEWHATIEMGEYLRFGTQATASDSEFKLYAKAAEYFIAGPGQNGLLSFNPWLRVDYKCTFNCKKERDFTTGLDKIVLAWSASAADATELDVTGSTLGLKIHGAIKYGIGTSDNPIVLEPQVTLSIIGARLLSRLPGLTPVVKGAAAAAGELGSGSVRYDLPRYQWECCCQKIQKVGSQEVRDVTDCDIQRAINGPTTPAPSPPPGTAPSGPAPSSPSAPSQAS